MLQKVSLGTSLGTVEAGARGLIYSGADSNFYVLTEAGHPWTSKLDSGGMFYHFLVQNLPFKDTL